MVKIYRRKNSEAVPSELVGLEDPTPYIHALFHYTAKMDDERAKMAVSKAHEVSAPVDSLARHVKAMSLFPNIYRGPQTHRTFKKVATDDMDGENYVRKPSKKERREGEV